MRINCTSYLGSSQLGQALAKQNYNYFQVSTLVSLQLLSRSSKSEVLDTPKYKSLITLALAQHLAR